MPETLRGRGRLVLVNRTYNVDYELAGDRGRLMGLSAGDVHVAITEIEPARLVLEDHRSVTIVVESDNGDFKLVGSIRYELSYGSPGV